MENNLILVLMSIIGLLIIITVIFGLFLYKQSKEQKKLFTSIIEEKNTNNNLQKQLENYEELKQKYNESHLDLKHTTLKLAKEEERSKELNKVQTILNEYNRIENHIDNKFKHINDFLESFTNSASVGKKSELLLENLLNAYGYINNKTGEVGTYTTQETIGDLRPDLILNITKDKYIIIDSKSVVLDYDNEDMYVLADNIHNSAKLLSKKKYELINDKSLDFVILFTPFDDILKFIDLTSIPKNIVVATNSTLIPILLVLKNQIKQERYTNISSIREDMIKIHKHLINSLNEFYKTKKSLENALKSIEKFENSIKSIENIEDLFNSFQNTFEISETETKKIQVQTLKSIKKT